MIDMVKILSSDYYLISGMTILLISQVAKDIEDPKLKEELNDAIKLILDNQVEKKGDVYVSHR